MRFPTKISYGEIGYTLPLLDYEQALHINAGMLFCVVGSTASPFNVKIGGNYVSYFVELGGAGDDIPQVIGVSPLVEVGLLKHVYIRGGSMLGLSMSLAEIGCPFLPIVQAGAAFYF